MEIFVDGSATPNRHGWACVTGDKVYYGTIKKFKGNFSQLPETLALIKAVTVAKFGDVIHTDQEHIVQRLEKYGRVAIPDMPEDATQNAKMLNNIYRKLDMVIQRREGVTITWLPREYSQLKAGCPGAFIADRVAARARGGLHMDVTNTVSRHNPMSKNLIKAIGERVIA